MTEEEVKIAPSGAITVSYNEDRYNPVDGELVKAADDLTAFMEYLALQKRYFESTTTKAVQEKRVY